jgi:hypothetical protein
MSSSLPSLFVAAEEVHRELPMPAVAYGLIALASFAVLLGILWSFRGTAQKVAGGHAHDGAGHHVAGHGPVGPH